MDMAKQAKPRRSAAAAPITIDDLPIDLLIHILSFLPIFFAVKTSLVSRKWRNLWHLIPILEFYLETPNHRNPADHLSMANRITQIFLNRPKSNPIREFRLSFLYSPDHRHRSLVSSWIRTALACNAEEMELGFYSEEYGLYDFHFSDLRNMHVRCLCLSDCEVVMPRSDSIRFDSIRVLSLTTVLITDESLTSLISKCGNLEKFSLDLGILSLSRKFVIRSKSLKVLQLIGYFGAVIEDCKESSLEICTPNLSSIEIDNFYVDSYKGDLSFIDEAKLMFSTRVNYSEKCWSSVMDLLRGAKKLNILSPSPMFMCSKFKSDGFVLERLKHLELKTCCKLGDVYGLSSVFERCPALETLVLNLVPETNEEKEEKDEDKEDEEVDQEDEDMEEDEEEEEEEDEDEDEEEEEIEEGEEEEDEDEKDEEVDQEETMRMLVALMTFRFHIPRLEELKIQGSTGTVREAWLVTLITLSQRVLKKFVSDPTIPSSENTDRGGFMHYPF